jgi:NAD(P)-dependent dehydrogenase (short-subunit alcohol dehydrogenase family)
LLFFATTKASTMAMKKVLVTGANKGIGKAICQALLEQHLDVHVLLGSRDAGRGVQAVQDLKLAVGAERCEGRLDLVEIDTSSDESVKQAAKVVAEKFTSDGHLLYGIINNAGIGLGHSLQDTVNTNYFGPRRVNDAFEKLLQRPGGRIVNVASASGPMFVAELADRNLANQFKEPWKFAGGVGELDQLAKTMTTENFYGFSKALLNAYTVLHARLEPDLIINACSPGLISTDMSKGRGSPPSKGAAPAVWLLMSEDLTKVPTGRYYGSDCVRSPLHVYRNPGDPAYED